MINNINYAMNIYLEKRNDPEEKKRSKIKIEVDELL